jgi:hypothetical protein
MGRMARLRLRPKPWALAIAAWDVWRRLPSQQRQQILGLARKHGPKLAKRFVESKARRRK